MTKALKKKPNTKSTVFVLYPFRDRCKDWVFNDSTKNLKNEYLIDGVPEIIEMMTKHIPNANKGFKLIFSNKHFAGSTALDWVRKDEDGNRYKLRGTVQEGWLCPALFKYFQKRPRTIYFRCEAKSAERKAKGKKAIKKVFKGK